MVNSPFVLSDTRRVEVFGLIGRRRKLLHDGTQWCDPAGIAWLGTRLANRCFALTWLGPGWVFDLYVRSRRAEQYAVQLQAMETAADARHRQELAAAAEHLRLGQHAERLLWTVHRKVMGQARSVVAMADFELASALWGRDRDAWPRHWRKTILAILEGLSWLHVADWTADSPPALGAGSALITNVRDLRDTERDRCPTYCPGHGGAPHHHFLVNIGRGFLGVLEGFGTLDENTGERIFDFTVGTARSRGTTLWRLGKRNHLTSIYLPSKLGNPRSCGTFTADHRMVFDAVVREMTRKKRRSRSRAAEPEIIQGNRVPDASGRKKIACELLGSEQTHVAFGGNKKRKGLGYRLNSPGGWLAKAGFARDNVQRLLILLAELAEPLGLIVVGLMPAANTWHTVSQLKAMAESAQGRRTLDRVHLRVYTQADFVDRWNTFFQWSDPTAEPNGQADSPLLELLGALQRLGVTRRALAAGIGRDASLVSKILSGKRRYDDRFLEQAEAWLATLGSPRPAMECCSPPSAPNVVTDGSALSAALSYHQRGWSIIPQVPRAKKPPIKWRPFQTRQPTAAEPQSWWSRWPAAGVALITGPLSGVLVVDADGPEAHDTLIRHLGSEPMAPKVLSGSREPSRYHLFFRHPDFSTKAKATPWHPKLEFRGNRALVVLPPSLHKSGNLYAWARGQSLDDLPLPELPAEITAALRPLPRPSQALRPRAEGLELAGTLDASPSTRDFHTGRYADGPGWNPRLFRAACDLHGRGLALEEAEPLLLAGAQPWNASETEAARRTIVSAFSEPREPAIC